MPLDPSSYDTAHAQPVPLASRARVRLFNAWLKVGCFIGLITKTINPLAVHCNFCLNFHTNSLLKWDRSLRSDVAFSKRLPLNSIFPGSLKIVRLEITTATISCDSLGL